MNPDACRDVRERNQISYMNGSKTDKMTGYEDELSHKKQLPLKQNTKPFLRYRTTMTNTGVFSQGDAMTGKPDLTGFNKHVKHSIYYLGGVKTETKDASVPLPMQQIKINPQNSMQNLFTQNSYVRPVSASEVASGVHINSIKHALSASLAVSSLPEMSSVTSRQQTLHKNSFLRQLSETSSNVVGQASSNLANGSSLTKRISHDFLHLQRHNSFGSDASVMPCSSKSVAKEDTLKFANAVTDHNISMNSLYSKSSPALRSNILIVNRPSSQESVKPDGNTRCPSVKSTLDPTTFTMRQAGLHSDVSSHFYGTFPSISSEPNISTAASNIKSTDHGQSITQLSASSIGGTIENICFKRMPVTNTLTGLVQCQHPSESRAILVLTSENTNSSNIAWQNCHEQTDWNGLPVSQLTGVIPVSPGLTPLLEMACAQSHIKPTRKETRTDMTPQTVTSNPLGVKTVQTRISVKPPVNLNIGKRTVQMPVSISQKSKTIEAPSSKLLSENHSQGASEKKVSACISSVTSVIEKRSTGDGAPSATKRLSETSHTRIDKVTAAVNAGSDVEGSDDEENDDDFSGSLEVNEKYRSNESFSKGERLPGDGEANVEVDVEDEELESYDDNDDDDDEIPGLDNSLKCAIQPATSTENAVTKPAFKYSLFHGIPPTINFVMDGERTEELPFDLGKLLKWRMSPITPNVVKSALARIGFKITKRNHDWLGCYGKHMKSNCFKSLHEYQKLNHFPGSFQIGRKDKLWRSLSKMQVYFGRQEFNFFPQTFVLPGDMKMLKQVWEESNTKQKWIIKPPASARGIGIRVICKWSQIPRRRPVIVQKYIHHPFLINASKFDMRIYVYVSCYDPLRLYVYEDGLARFASCKYSSSTKTLSNRYMHLTNYSVNKTNSDYLSNGDNTVCQGHKWSLKALWNYMKRQGINTNLIWETIRDLIIKTIISGEAAINSVTKANTCSRYCCHELFGFDILLDEHFKPWILEVNISPSLHSNSQLDMNIKGAMIKDMMNIAGIRLPDERDIVNSRSGIESSGHSPLNSFCIDKRLFTNQLAPDERAKHLFYCQRYLDEQVVSSILNILTPDDIRLLCESIDEDSRRGSFQRLFPTPSTHRYLRYFEQPRYYNLLLDQWVLHYNHKELNGVKLLQSLCGKGLHLQNPTTNPHHQWSLTRPSLVAAATKSSDIRILGKQNSTKESKHQIPVPQNRKKVPLKPGQLSQSSSSNSLNSINLSHLLHSALSPNPLTSSNSDL